MHPTRQNFYSFQVKSHDGSIKSLAGYKGQVVLVVNVASRCGFTPQYKGLEAIYKKYRDRGFVVVAFPCNQFGSQEPGSDDEIQSFCKLTYDVDFPVMAKIAVNGEQADPIYTWLKNSAPGFLGIEAIKWNFTKFLISRSGEVIDRFAPQTGPESIEPAIEKALG